MLGWLSVWSKVQTCIWPSWCYCQPLSLASVKSRLVLPFWCRLTPVVPDKGPLNVCVFIVCFINCDIAILACDLFKNCPLGPMNKKIRHPCCKQMTTNMCLDVFMSYSPNDSETTVFTDYKVLSKTWNFCNVSHNRQKHSNVPHEIIQWASQVSQHRGVQLLTSFMITLIALTHTCGYK